MNTIYAFVEETLPSSDDRNKLWVKPAIKGEIAFMPINKTLLSDPGKVQVPSIEVHGLHQQFAPANENYFKLSSRDDEPGKHHGFSKRQTANFLQFSDRDPHKSRSPGKELGKVYSENEIQGDWGKDSEADPDNQDPNLQFQPAQASPQKQGKSAKPDSPLKELQKQYNSTPPDPKPPQNPSVGVKSSTGRKKPQENLLTESEPDEEGDYINGNLSQEEQLKEEDPQNPSDIKPNEASTTSKPAQTGSSKPVLSLAERRKEAQRKKDLDNTANNTPKSGTEKNATPPRKPVSPLPSPKSKVDTAGLSLKSAKKPGLPQPRPGAQKDTRTTASQLGRPQGQEKQLNRNKTDSNLLGLAASQAKQQRNEAAQAENQSLQRRERAPQEFSSNSDDGQHETSSAHSQQLAEAPKQPNRHIFTAENVNREQFDDPGSEDEKDIRNEIPEDFKPKSSRGLQAFGSRGKPGYAARPIEEQPNEHTGENTAANRSPRCSVGAKGFPQTSILMDERRSATNRDLLLPKSKLELSNIIKKSSHRFSVGPESIRQSTLPALVEPIPDPVDKREFFVEKQQPAGGFTISRLPRFDNRPALNIDAIKHIKRFPAAASDKVQSALH